MSIQNFYYIQIEHTSIFVTCRWNCRDRTYKHLCFLQMELQRQNMQAYLLLVDGTAEIEHTSIFVTCRWNCRDRTYTHICFLQMELQRQNIQAYLFLIDGTAEIEHTSIFVTCRWNCISQHHLLLYTRPLKGDELVKDCL